MSEGSSKSLFGYARIAAPATGIVPEIFVSSGAFTTNDTKLLTFSNNHISQAQSLSSKLLAETIQINSARLARTIVDKGILGQRKRNWVVQNALVRIEKASRLSVTYRLELVVRHAHIPDVVQMGTGAWFCLWLYDLICHRENICCSDICRITAVFAQLCHKRAVVFLLKYGWSAW